MSKIRNIFNEILLKLFYNQGFKRFPLELCESIVYVPLAGGCLCKMMRL